MEKLKTKLKKNNTNNNPPIFNANSVNVEIVQQQSYL